MYKQLVKIGKRKCMYCQKILDLNEANFNTSRQKGRGGFLRYCKPCTKIHLKNLHQKYIEWDMGQREKLLKKLGNKCNCCGLTSNVKGFFDIDHIIPQLKGTKKFSKFERRAKIYQLNNLQILCPNCHRLKTLTDAQLWKKKKNEVVLSGTTS